MSDKIQTMLNFAIRASKTVFGVDNIPSCKSKHVIIACSSLSENSLKQLLKENTKTPIILSKRPLEEIIHRGGKAIAVKDKNMANEILKNINDDYELISEGN
ncbi:MAG: hypothetical protein E7353_00515 [Clostridiales bacterium]|nr:hypothetical protein [Clostridiales bacterium]